MKEKTFAFFFNISTKITHFKSCNRYKQKSPAAGVIDEGKKVDRVVFYLFLSWKMMNFTG